ncbi:diacylglycerol kinase family enzyme [Streptomyces sp. TLI_171]|nr:diacylglycerol kinase family enzyme [Streptomyces sp. TLI_171]
MRAKWLARASIGCGLAAVLMLAAGAGLRGALVVAVGLVTLVLMGVGGWWALSRRGPVRWLGAALAVAAPSGAVVLYVGGGTWPWVLGVVALWAVGLSLARAALRAGQRVRPMAEREVDPPRKPVLIMNPRSGGGKVEKFDLAAKARELGAEVVLLDPTDHQDVTELAERAVADGADLLGVAGGDGTQAQVAQVAARHGLPFLVVSAGTRNHFALDLGLDRTDPARCLDALTDGVELRVDLGEVAGRAFVNNVSFGTYAEIVQHPDYRDAKAATTLALLPDLLVGYGGAQLAAEVGGQRLERPQAVLVSNNPYDAGDLTDPGRRSRLDRGWLGVLGVKVDGAAQAADLALRGTSAEAVTTLMGREVLVTADAESIPVAVDGEALELDVPVRCVIHPAALRVRVPRDRPGTVAPVPALKWSRLARLAADGGAK